MKVYKPIPNMNRSPVAAVEKYPYLVSRKF